MIYRRRPSDRPVSGPTPRWRLWLARVEVFAENLPSVPLHVRLSIAATLIAGSVVHNAAEQARMREAQLDALADQLGALAEQLQRQHAYIELQQERAEQWERDLERARARGVR